MRQYGRKAYKLPQSAKGDKRKMKGRHSKKPNQKDRTTTFGDRDRMVDSRVRTTETSAAVVDFFVDSKGERRSAPNKEVKPEVTA